MRTPTGYPTLRDYAAYEAVGSALPLEPVAVVTVLLNAVATVGATLTSVQSQPRPVRHVIVDGGSTDGTLEYVRAHRRPRTS